MMLGNSLRRLIGFRSRLDAMTKFRQPIRKGNKGGDVLAVKRALKAMGRGHGVTLNYVAGPNFVADIKAIQKKHNLHADGVYGLKTHAVVAPHFDKFGVWLYTHAKIRSLAPVRANSQTSAEFLLGSPKYHADNSADLNDLRATAAGKRVPSQCGGYVWIDARPLQAICHLIALGYKIGTYAICSDHHCDGMRGHAGGFCIDISSINGVSVAENSQRAKTLVLEVTRALNAAGSLKPHQLISGGYGNHRDKECSACSIPAADSFYGSVTMAQHCNHIHIGY